jgi:uncharacterized protein (DUF1501 family)
VLRGELAVTSWAPSRLPETDDDTLARVRRLYEAADPSSPLFERRARSRAIAGDSGDAAWAAASGCAARERRGAIPVERQRARIAVLDAGGWDTHATKAPRRAARAAARA